MSDLKSSCIDVYNCIKNYDETISPLSTAKYAIQCTTNLANVCTLVDCCHDANFVAAWMKEKNINVESLVAGIKSTDRTEKIQLLKLWQIFQKKALESLQATQNPTQ